MKNLLLKSMMLLSMLMVGMGAWADTTGTITFGTNDVKINAASVNGDDDLGNSWTITTVGTTSFTTNAAYYQVGSSSKPATSITFTTTLSESSTIKSMSAKFGGYSGTAGAVTLKVGSTTVGTGSLNEANDVTVNSTTSATGTVLTVTVTGISKGVKVYNISYTIEDGDGVDVTAPTLSVAAGTYNAVQNVKISNYDDDLLYFYTTDGTTPAADELLNPTGTSQVYDDNDGVDITASCTLKVIAYDEDGNTSSVTSAAYVIDLPVVIPTSNLIVKYDFNDKNAYPTGFKTSGTNIANAQEFTISGNAIIINAPTSYYQINSGNDASRALFYGKTGAYLGFPAKPGYKLVEVYATTGSSVAGNVEFNVVDTEGNAMSASCKTVASTKKTFVFTLSNPTVSTEYRLKTITADKNMQIDNVVLVYKAVVSVSDAEYATYYNAYKYTMPTGLTGKIMENENGTIKATTIYEAGAVVPAHTALILNGAEDAYTLEGTEDMADADDTEYVEAFNLLKGTLVEATTTGGNVYYKLAAGENGLGWYWGAEDGAAFTIGANKAYLALDAAVSAAKFISLFEETDGINNVNANASSNAIYNIAGQRVNANAKGIVIMNGKKYLNK